MTDLLASRARSSPGRTSEFTNRLDVTNVLTIWLVVLYGISAGLVIPGFGAIGQPATLFALGALLWWGTGRMLPSLGLDRSRQPVRVALAIYTIYIIGSYGLAGTRVLSDIERTNSTRSLIATLALFGIAALVADGVPDRERLRTLLRRLTTLGALFAVYGIVQAVAGEAFQITPPGLVWNSGGPSDVSFRGGLARPLATGLHPIEYSVIVASLVPLAIHFAIHPRGRNDRIRALVEGLFLLLAVPVSLSRTGVLCLTAGLLVLAFGWTWRRRFNAGVVAVLTVPLIAILVPGAYRVMVGLFSDPDSDPSVQARIERIPNIMALIRERPWFGMGHGTFNGEDHFLIDNQLWVTIISDGMIGLALTLGLFLTAALTAMWSVHRLGASAESAHMGRAIAASIAAIVVSLVTFDAFFYRILSFTLFLLVGAAGALWRLSGERTDTGPAASP